MFDLDREITAWSARVLPAGCSNEGERRAELEDHLRCEIEALQQRGENTEQAFRTAIELMGDQTRLAKEFAKNRSLLSTLCLIEGGSMNNDKPIMKSVKLSGVIIGQAIVWAAIMIAVSSELAGTGIKDTVMQWLMAGWFASFLLPVVLMEGNSVKAECAWIRRRLGFGKTA